MRAVLTFKGIGKSFGATRALNDISYDIEAGEVRALLGENGAGKSTCVKILNGLIRPDSGTISLDEHPFRPANLKDAQRAGVSTAFQELSLIPELSVAVNLAMPDLPTRAGIVGFRELRRRAEAILAEYRVTNIDPLGPISQLSLAEKQRLEIIRALHRQPKLLVLDEPTAALTDVGWLYEQVRLVAKKGGAVLFISHRLAEVRELCSKATVLRNGEVAGTIVLSESTDNDLFRLMIGRSAGKKRHDAASTQDMLSLTPREPVLTATELLSSEFGPGDIVLRRGEIVGVAALEGQGQRALFNILSGNAQPIRGTMRVGDSQVPLASPAVAKSMGIAFVPEERKEEALFFGMSTMANVSIARLQSVSRFGLVQRRNELAAVGGVADKVGLEARYLDMPIDALSGGNQQKAVIARALLLNADCLLLFDPTRGVDVGTKEAIFAAIRKFADDGGCVLFYSTELRELTDLCDRCLVLYGKRIVAEHQGADLNEEALIDRMHGRDVYDARLESEGEVNAAH